MPHSEVSAKNGVNINQTLINFILKVGESKVNNFELKDIYMNFLLNIFEDFDDDLLQDAIEILNYE